MISSKPDDFLSPRAKVQPAGSGDPAPPPPPGRAPGAPCRRRRIDWVEWPP